MRESYLNERSPNPLRDQIPQNCSVRLQHIFHAIWTTGNLGHSHENRGFRVMSQEKGESE